MTQKSLTRKKAAKLLITKAMKHPENYTQEEINYAFATLRHIKIEKIQQTQKEVAQRVDKS